jgi:hypothetical protein
MNTKKVGDVVKIGELEPGEAFRLRTCPYRKMLVEHQSNGVSVYNSYSSPGSDSCNSDTLVERAQPDTLEGRLAERDAH